MKSVILKWMKQKETELPQAVSTLLIEILVFRHILSHCSFSVAALVPIINLALGLQQFRNCGNLNNFIRYVCLDIDNLLLAALLY